MTENAPKGARREAPRPFGGVEGHENGFKMSKKCLEDAWGHFFDIFWTFCRSPAGPQDIFLTFLGHFVGDPQNDPQDILETFFGESRKTPLGTVLHTRILSLP